MHKIFLAVSSMIVAAFLVKSYRKLKNKDEVYRLMRAAYEDHLKIERRRADARETFNRMDAISTPRNGGLLSPIDAIQKLRDALRLSPEQTDAMAIGSIGRFS